MKRSFITVFVLSSNKRAVTRHNMLEKGKDGAKEDRLVSGKWGDRTKMKKDTN